jgi:hypothetical protein
MDIGKAKRVYHVEPLVNPVPQAAPLVAQQSTPPRKPELVPAK